MIFGPATIMLRATVGLALVFSLAPHLCGQQKDKCSPAVKTERAFKYRIGKSFRTVKGPPTLVVYISVKPQYFNREDMLSFAQQLNRDFCHEQRVSIWIFDAYPSAQSFAPHPHSLTYDRDMEALRGFYRLNRETHEETIQFSSSRGKPRDEIKIDLGSSSNEAKSFRAEDSSSDFK
jgi:hypothetical protein